MSGPNVFKAGFAALWAMRVSRPREFGEASTDHLRLRPVLTALAAPGGLDTVDAVELAAYVDETTSVAVPSLTRGHALAFWINLYNALAIQLVLETRDRGLDSVLDVRAAFERGLVTVAGERLSLTDIEHGKIRRFRDARAHGALVCGSLSCPTLRPEPFDGESVEGQLEDQMRRFVTSGGAVADTDAGTVSLSRVFLWYGADFVRPDRMPTWVPASRKAVGRAAVAWLGADVSRWYDDVEPRVVFQTYDWGVGCAVA